MASPSGGLWALGACWGVGRERLQLPSFTSVGVNRGTARAQTWASAWQPHVPTGGGLFAQLVLHSHSPERQPKVFTNTNF